MTKGIDEIVRSGLRQKLWQPSASVRGVHIGRDEIERLIPHRDPFLFVDTISEIDLDSSRIRGQRFIAPSDPVFAGHFPGHAVYPGVLLVETMAQFGLCLLHFTGKRAFNVRFIRIHHAAFTGTAQHVLARWYRDGLDAFRTSPADGRESAQPGP